MEAKGEVKGATKGCLAIIVILFLLFLIPFMIIGYFLYEEHWDEEGETVIQQVVDGNTLVLEADGKRIQMDLAFVDTPPPDSYHGRMAIQFLNKELQNPHLTYSYRLSNIEDKYLGEIRTGRNSPPSVNKKLIQQGLARVVVPERDWKDATIQSYMDAQQEAQREKRGIWAHKGYVTKDGFDAEIGKQILQEHEAAKRRARQEAKARKRQQIEEEKTQRRQLTQVLDTVKKSDERIAFIRYQKGSVRKKDSYSLIVDVYVKEEAWADMTKSQKMSLVAVTQKKIHKSLRELGFIDKKYPAYVSFFSDTAEDLLARKKTFRFSGSEWLILR